jgi:peptide/nickel transport system substrate-binding protein
MMLVGCAPIAPPSAPDTNDATGERTARQVVDISAFTTLDPSAACWGEYFVLGNVYETLTRYNPPGVEPFVAPGLATDWTVADEGHTWAFHLQEGVKFHDGSDLNAEAVKFSIERNKESHGPRL